MPLTSPVQAVESLNLDLDWRIGEDAFRFLVDDLSTLKPRYILEFGSGASSVRIAQEFSGVSILSIEHDARYWKKTLELKASYLTNGSSLQVALRPLRWQRHGLGWYKSYSFGHLPNSLDAIIIDGPPHYTRRGREACLYQAIGRLREGGRVYLDDYEREDERHIVANWLATFPNTFEIKEISVGHHICVLTKTHESPAALSLLVARDNWGGNLRLALQSLSIAKRRIFR